MSIPPYKRISLTTKSYSVGVDLTYFATFNRLTTNVRKPVGVMVESFTKVPAALQPLLCSEASTSSPRSHGLLHQTDARLQMPEALVDEL